MKTVLALALTVAILLAAGTTAAMAATTMQNSDLTPGRYTADDNKNVLTVNKDNTFKYEAPGIIYTGTLTKQSTTGYIGVYNNPMTNKQVQKMFTYDTATKTIKVPGEGSSIFKMK